MKPILLLMGALALVASTASAAKPVLHQDNHNHHYYIIKINDLQATNPQEIAHHLGVTYVGQVGELAKYHLFSYPKTTSVVEKRSLLNVNNNSNDLCNATTSASTNHHHNDIIVKRYEEFKSSSLFTHHIQKRAELVSTSSLLEDELHPLGDINKQVLRRRWKRAMIELDPRDENTPGEPQPADGVADHFQIKDPGFKYQWHLHNTEQVGNDINVTGVWENQITGKGAIVAIIDDGLDMHSEDLAQNFHAAGSHDFNDNAALPEPRLIDDNHGTRCAGEIASARNNLCGVGVAWDAKVAGLRILSGEITDVQEAEAINFGFNQTQIYSCSWGPRDDGKSMDGPNQLLLDAFINGVENGREGKGSIFVFATGNGGRSGDNCNFDGYANSRYTISIGAITRIDTHPEYSEACSAQLGVTYSSGFVARNVNSHIYTCDVGKRNCTNNHSGTSAAAPIAAGIFALVLEVRPDLNWRDMQYLTVHTAVPIDENDPDWKETSVGRLFNHKYGYGKLDAYAIVEAAKTWVSVGEHVSYNSPVVTVNADIPNGDGGMPSVILVTEKDLKAVKFGSLEHVTVTVNIEHAFRGEIEVFLKSPDNIISKLAEVRPQDDSSEGFNNWTFMSVKHWEENPIGQWTLTVYDRINPLNTGIFKDWKLSLHGEIEGGRPNVPGPQQPAAPTPQPAVPKPQPTTSATVPTKTDTPEGSDKNAGDGRLVLKISPFIYVMFGGMFIAIGGALFLMYRQRTHPRSMFGSGLNDDEEAAQRGGLLGRRGDYEFDELPTHGLGDSDSDSDDDDDHFDPRLDQRIVFDKRHVAGAVGEGDKMKELKSSRHHVEDSEVLSGTPYLSPRGMPSSPLSSGEEIEQESSFEVAGADNDDDEAEEEDEDDEDDEGNLPGGSGSKINKKKSGSWDEFDTLVKQKDGKTRQ
ncbi:pheromone processing endoprotease [Podila epigama]|nr:pheromone processing endoprotease [Podila epigama]